MHLLVGSLVVFPLKREDETFVKCHMCCSFDCKSPRCFLLVKMCLELLALSGEVLSMFLRPIFQIIPEVVGINFHPELSSLNYFHLPLTG